MANLTIVANIKAKPDKIELVKNELEKLIDITRAEKGCVQYDLHQDNDNPAHFLFLRTGSHVCCGSNTSMPSTCRTTWQQLMAR